MDIKGFKAYLQEKTVDTKKISDAITIIEEYSKFISKSIDETTYDDFQDFSAYLIKNNKNTWDNYISIQRYGYYKGNNLLIIASMEVIDGGEVMVNFSQRLIDELDSLLLKKNL